MKATILINIADNQVRCHLDCDTREKQEVLEPILPKIRRVVEEALSSIEAGELVVSMKE